MGEVDWHLISGLRKLTEEVAGIIICLYLPIHLNRFHQVIFFSELKGTIQHNQEIGILLGFLDIGHRHHYPYFLNYELARRCETVVPSDKSLSERLGSLSGMVGQDLGEMNRNVN